MGSEIDTKSIEPVRNAVSLFGHKGDQKKYHQSTSSKSDCEKELEDLTKELANCKVQLEAKHSAHMQALLKVEHNQKMIHELSTLLKRSDIERNKNMNECSECNALKEELKSKVADQNLETVKIRDQLSHVLSELKAIQRELLNKETELVAARDSELNALAKTNQLESALEAEKEQKEELLQQVKELNKVIHNSKLASKLATLSEKDEEIELATKATSQVQKQLEDMRKDVEMLQGLQNQPMEKFTLGDSLPLEPMQANETLILSEHSTINAINHLNQFNIDMLNERKIMEQSVYIETLEMELSQLKQELVVAKEEINSLNITNESIKSELHETKAQLNMNKGSDIEAQVEIALLKSQLQEHRLAYGHVAEVDERNSENNENDHVSSKYVVEKIHGVQGLVGEVGRLSELALMKKELENASVKISELRARAEQALSRAELAENAKAALEDKIRRHREHRQRRRAALTALREESTPKPFSPSSSYGQGTPKTYQPLGKVLNMKL